MVVHFKVDFEDMIAMQKNFIKTSKVHKKRNIIFSVLGFALVLLLLNHNGFLKAMVYALLFYLFTTYVLYPSVTLFKAKKIFQKHKSKYDYLTGDCTLTIDNEGILKEFDNEYHTKEYIKWAEIVKVNRDEKHYYFYKSDLNALMIKKYPDNMNRAETLKYNQFIEELLIKEGVTKKIEG